MTRPLIAALVIAAASLTAGCDTLGIPGFAGGSANGAAASPSATSQTTIIALQTWLVIEQQKAAAAGKTARAASAGNLVSSLGALRTEPNCARRLQLATAVSGGLQSEFPTYQAELSLGTNLVGILAAGFPGCQ